MCLLRCIQGPSFRVPSSFFFRLNPPHLLTACSFVPIADPPACSTSGLTSRVFRQCHLTSPPQRQIRAFDVARHTHTKQLHTAPLQTMLVPPCALACKVRSSCPSTRPRDPMCLYRPGMSDSHTVDCAQEIVSLETSSSFGSGLIRHRRTKGPKLLPTRATVQQACTFLL